MTEPKSPVERTQNLSLGEFVEKATGNVHFVSDGTTLHAIPKDVTQGSSEKATETKSKLTKVFSTLTTRVNKENASIETYAKLKETSKQMRNTARSNSPSSIWQSFKYKWVNKNLDKLTEEIKKKEASLKPVTDVVKELEAADKIDPKESTKKMIEALKNTPFVLPTSSSKGSTLSLKGILGQTQLPKEQSVEEDPEFFKSKIEKLLLVNYTTTLNNLQKASTVEKKRELRKTLEEQCKAKDQFPKSGIREVGTEQIDSVSEKIGRLLNNGTTIPKGDELLVRLKELTADGPKLEQLYFLAKGLPDTDENRSLFMHVALISIDQLARNGNKNSRVTLSILQEDIRKEFENIKKPLTEQQILFLHYMSLASFAIVPEALKRTIEEPIKRKLPEDERGFVHLEQIEKLQKIFETEQTIFNILEKKKLMQPTPPLRVNAKNMSDFIQQLEYMDIGDKEKDIVKVESLIKALKETPFVLPATQMERVLSLDMKTITQLEEKVATILFLNYEHTIFQFLQAKTPEAKEAFRSKLEKQQVFKDHFSALVDKKIQERSAKGINDEHTKEPETFYQRQYFLAQALSNDYPDREALIKSIGAELEKL